MLTRTILSSFLLAGVVCAPLSLGEVAAFQPATDPPLFEIRLAQDVSAPGLVRHTVGTPPEDVFVQIRAVITDSDIESLSITRVESGLSMRVRFTPDAAARLNREAAAWLDRKFALFLDSHLIAALTVRTPMVVGGPSNTITMGVDFDGFPEGRRSADAFVERARERWPGVVAPAQLAQ